MLFCTAVSRHVEPRCISCLPTTAHPLPVLTLPASTGEHVPPWWERWLPLRRMSDEEWRDYQYNKKHGFQERCVP